jgi:hypothetical protein
MTPLVARHSAAVGAGGPLQRRRSRRRRAGGNDRIDRLRHETADDSFSTMRTYAPPALSDRCLGLRCRRLTLRVPCRRRSGGLRRCHVQPAPRGPRPVARARSCPAKLGKALSPSAVRGIGLGAPGVAAQTSCSPNPRGRRVKSKDCAAISNPNATGVAVRAASRSVIVRRKARTGGGA